MAIYYPETIDSQEIYGTYAEETTSNAGSGTVSSSTGSKSSSSSQNNTQPTTTFPPKVIPVILPQVPTANDTIGHSINTKTNKILGAYTFGKVGSLQIGEYANGTSGDIRITPDGITARNASGTNTFVIDGQTGDAEFFGTIKAGSLVVGYVASVGGTYTTASATAAKVQLLPNASTGIVAYAQDGATVVFKVWVAGTEVGDVQIGNYTGGNGALWDNSAGTLFLKGNFTAGNITGVSISGNTISGGTISGTTITGSSINTGTSGSRVQMDTNGDNIQFYNSSGTEGFRLTLSSSDKAVVNAKGGRSLYLLTDSGTVYFASNSLGNISQVNFGNANLGQLGNISTSGTISGGTISGSHTGSFSGNLSGSVSGGTISGTQLTMSEWGSFGGDVDMNGNSVKEIDALNFNPRSSTPSDAGSWGQWAHSSGGTYQMRIRLNGANYYQVLNNA